MDIRTQARGGTLENQRHHGGPEEGDQVIRVRNLTKVYRGGITAVVGLDLSNGRGEVFRRRSDHGAETGRGPEL